MQIRCALMAIGISLDAAVDAAEQHPYPLPMNRLPLAKRCQILRMVCEGSSLRSASRTAEVSINTVSKLCAEAGEAAIAISEELSRNTSSSSRSPLTPQTRVSGSPDHAQTLRSFVHIFCIPATQGNITPAMARGITDRLWTLDDLVATIDMRTPRSFARGPYQKRNSN
jgi:hypothetical protein